MHRRFKNAKYVNINSLLKIPDIVKLAKKRKKIFLSFRFGKETVAVSVQKAFEVLEKIHYQDANCSVLY